MEVFQEMSNAPASVTAVGLLLAIAVLLGFVVTVRDALQAYLQARMDGEGRTQIWIVLSKDWWLDEWFFDGAKRQRPKYRRPVVHRRLALYGHLESGPLWDKTLLVALIAIGWAKVSEWPGVWRNIAYSCLLVYIDDILVICKKELVQKQWKAIEKAIEFKDDPEPIGQFIGARCTLSEHDPKDHMAVRGLSISMCGHIKRMSEHFATEAVAMMISVRSVKTPPSSNECLH